MLLFDGVFGPGPWGVTSGTGVPRRLAVVRHSGESVWNAIEPR